MNLMKSKIDFLSLIKKIFLFSTLSLLSLSHSAHSQNHLTSGQDLAKLVSLIKKNQKVKFQNQIFKFIKKGKYLDFSTPINSEGINLATFLLGHGDSFYIKHLFPSYAGPILNNIPIESVDKLLSAGLDRSSVFSNAVAVGSPEIFKKLLWKGPFAIDDQTARQLLERSISMGNENFNEILKFAREKNLNLDGALVTAVSLGKVDRAEILLEEGANPNAKQSSGVYKIFD